MGDAKMKHFYRVTAQTRNKTWDRQVADEGKAKQLAAEWTAKYRATCTVERVESGFLVSGGRYQDSRTIDRTETDASVRRRRVREAYACVHDWKLAEQIVDAATERELEDFYSGTVTRILKRLEVA